VVPLIGDEPLRHDFPLQVSDRPAGERRPVLLGQFTREGFDGDDETGGKSGLGARRGPVRPDPAGASLKKRFRHVLTIWRGVSRRAVQAYEHETPICSLGGCSGSHDHAPVAGGGIPGGPAPGGGRDRRGEQEVDAARIIPLDGRRHLPQNVRQWVGDSRGRWDGDTLVVETTNFTHQGTGTISLRPSTDEHLHLVERFTRLDADTLLYEFTVNDPAIWTKPWTAVVPMKKSPDRMYEYACHEGNYGMFGILAGARADERVAEEPSKEKK
jgi:hypothetical protein